MSENPAEQVTENAPDETINSGEFREAPREHVEVRGDLWRCPHGRWHLLAQSCVCAAMRGNQ